MMPAPPPLRSRRSWASAAIGSFAAILLQTTVAWGELTVGAAVSLRRPLDEIAALHERATGERVRLVFGASSALASQIRAGAPLDLLLSADAEISDALFARGEVELPLVFTSNRLVVVVAEDVPVPVEAPADLTHPTLRRLAIPARAVPVGRYARAWLAGRSLLDILRPRIVQTEHARATLAAVDQGNAQAAIVYRTDARLARRARTAFEIAAEEHPAIRYAATVVRGGDADAARRFLDRLASPAGRDALERSGFAPSTATP
jgi:molybdate transport system substrate-binding protein